LRQEVESVRSELRAREAQVAQLGRRCAAQAGAENQVATLSGALARAAKRERALEGDLAAAQVGEEGRGEGRGGGGRTLGV
jgi:hypothetical protein